MKASRLVGLVIPAILVGVVLGYYSQPLIKQATTGVNQTVTQTITQQTTITTYERGAYVHVAYEAYRVDSISLPSCDRKPSPGDSFVILTLKIENHGYEKLPVSPDFFYIIIDREHSLNPPVHMHPYAYYKEATFCLSDSLPAYDCSTV